MGWQALRGLVVGRDKLVLASRAELFDLLEDPDETHDLAETRADRVEALRQELERFTEQRGDLGWGVARSPGASEVEMLHALGYAQAAGPQPGDPLDPALPDPRDRLEEHRRFEQGNTAWIHSRRLERRAEQSEDPAERESLLEAVRATRERTLAELAPFGASGNALLLDLIGKLALKLGEYERSAAALERAVALQPRIASTHFNLGLAYRGLGRGEDARMAFERAHRLEPEQPGIAIMIARQYAEAGQRERARHWLSRARPRVPPGSGLEPALAAVDRILAESRETQPP